MTSDLENLGKYHYYDRMEDYRAKLYYSIPANEEELEQKLRGVDEYRKSFKHHEWIPM